LPLDTQLALYSKFQLPISAILTSGGGSAHAWIRLAAPDSAKYREWAKRILEALLPFGVDQANKNPSRLSRLPGVKRSIQPQGDGIQRLLYLNPAATGCTDESIAEFEKQVTPPFFTKTPLKAAVLRSQARYDDLAANQGKTGLATGITKFDSDTGGLKRGQFIVLAAETNVGKSSVGLNIVNQALKDGKPTALFSLEMDEDEILDLLFSMNFSVNRNVFNTGRFEQRDVDRIIAGSQRLSQMPLYVFDNPGLTIEDIERHAIELAAKTELALVVVDYLQLVLPPVTMRDNREQQIAFIGRSLRTLAKRLKVPVIAISQLNEEGKIRESRAVAHDAHIVFMLEADGNNMNLRVTKGRSIPKATYTLCFDALHCRVVEASPIDGTPKNYRAYNDN
jgi:KaiC/GvpD/RAD55 family RecA-like ATPase